MAVASTSVAISAGFSQNFFYVFYHPSLAGFSMTFTSVRLNMAWVTMVCFIYVGISLIIGDGLDFEAEDANPDLAVTLEESCRLRNSSSRSTGGWRARVSRGPGMEVVAGQRRLYYELSRGMSPCRQAGGGPWEIRTRYMIGFPHFVPSPCPRLRSLSLTRLSQRTHCP